MMDKLAALDGATIWGGPVTVRPGLSEREIAGVDRRAEIIVLLLRSPAGIPSHTIGEKLHISNGAVDCALSTLTEECPALYEVRAVRGWRVCIDRDEWRRTGWRAGGVQERRHPARAERLCSMGDLCDGGYLPTARVTTRDGRLRVTV